MSLVQVKAKLLRDHNITISTSSVANYLEGEMFTTKKVHWQPVTTNSERNKDLRKIYVMSLNNYVQGGNRIMWIDETNFNLFCRRTCGRSRQGNRATASRPASRGKFCNELFESLVFPCTCTMTLWALHSTLCNDKTLR